MSPNTSEKRQAKSPKSHDTPEGQRKTKRPRLSTDTTPATISKEGRAPAIPDQLSTTHKNGSPETPRPSKSAHPHVKSDSAGQDSSKKRKRHQQRNETEINGTPLTDGKAIPDDFQTPFLTKQRDLQVQSQLHLGNDESTPVSKSKKDKKDKKEKKKKHKRKSGSKELVTAVPGVESLPEDVGVVPVDESATDLARAALRSRQWNALGPFGGRFLDLAPVFAGKQKYLMLASASAVHLFSTSTSLLERSMQVEQGDSVAGFHLCPTSSDHVVLLTQKGKIVKFDWRTAQKVHEWETKSSFTLSNICISSIGDSAQDIVIAVTQLKGSLQLFAFVINSETKKSSIEPKLLLDNAAGITSIHSADHGRTLIASNGNKLLLGLTKTLAIHGSDFLVFTWRELTLPSPITALDVHERATATTATHSKKSKKTDAPPLDIVVGLLHGDILVYQDLLSKIVVLEKQSLEAGEVEPKPRRLHWHRQAVQVVRWSEDGNYLISGGSETVLVVWQLDTNIKQFVPHLSSTVVNIAVAPSGAYYAVTLADNCTIILSTADLRPTANISGLQIPSLDVVPRVSSSEKSTEESTGRQATAILHSTNPDRLLVAVPASQNATASTTGYPRAALVQTFDISLNSHISQQALARTNTTAREFGPDGSKITEPEIKDMKISFDGQSLATIDQWLPNASDTSALYVDNLRLDTNVERREIFLKFWSWSTSSNEWELVTRVDMPHGQSRIGLSGVLDLASHPAQAKFATVGEDATVRLWQAFDRYRNGVPVKDKEARTLVTWNCKQVIHLEGTNTSSEYRVPKHASLAYSEDGSILAVSWQTHFRATNKSHTCIHLIDVATGAIQHTVETPQLSGPCNVGFAGSHLVLLANALQVWDVVDFRIRYSLEIKEDKTQSSTPKILATNSKDETFAIACASSPSDTQAPIFAIFDPASPTPLYQLSSGSKIITAIMPDLKSGGYVTLDTAAEVRRFVSTPTGALADIELASIAPTATDGAIIGEAQEGDEMDLSAVFGGIKAIAGPTGSADASALSGAAVVQKQQLTEVFDIGPSFAMPSVSALFEKVATLFLGNDEHRNAQGNELTVN